ncbi:hypothetical protein L1887_46815 [Cichorium endivia]|nr:hypothetical protein L1887_46815 [Cichorium endivia]
MAPPAIPASRMRDGLEVVHASIEDFATTYRAWLTLAPAYSYAPALLPSDDAAQYLPDAETLARAYCPIAGPRWDEHRERMLASTSLKGLTVLRSQVDQSVKVDVVANNGDSWTRMYIVKPERLRQEFREAESYMVDEQDSSMDSDSEGADSFHEHRHTPHDTTHGVFGEGTASTMLDESMRHPKIEDAECGSGARYQHHFRTFSIRKEALEARAAELSLHDDAHDEAARALDHAAAKEGRALAIQLERELNIETLFDAILGPIWGNGAKPRQPVELFATVGVSGPAACALYLAHGRHAGKLSERAVGCGLARYLGGSASEQVQEAAAEHGAPGGRSDVHDAAVDACVCALRHDDAHKQHGQRTVAAQGDEPQTVFGPNEAGYTIHDSDDRIASSHGVAFSVDAIALARHGETYDSSLHASSHQSDSMGASQPDTVKKPSPMTPLSLQPEIEPIYYAEHAEHEQPASAGRRGVANRLRAFVLGPHPPKHLSIRHYRWWPLARVERAWIRLTDPLAWKQPPETIYSAADGAEMDSNVPPGLAWWRSVTADFKFNRLHWIALVAMCVGWILGFAFLAKALWYESSLTIDGVESTPAFLSCTSTYWLRNGECGIDGEACAPFYTPTAEAGQPFRCPAQCVDVTLLNPRAVGSELVNYQPLVVGGGDANRTYRGDSFICATAIHAGVIRNERGGCGSVRLVGAHAGFDASTAHGIESIGFDAAFPVAYRFEAVQGQTDCTDRRWQGYVVNALMTAVVGFVLRPKRIVWFWTLACVGFWHITLVSEPRDYPPPIGAAVGDFLPFLFVCYAIWRLAFRFVWPAFSHLPLESTLWTLGFWWLGVLLNVVFDKVPLQRLVARDISQQPGSLVALIVIVVVVLAIAVNQVRVMRATGELPKYLSLYALGGVGVGLAAAVPGETLRLHHYIIALVLLPACAFPTRLGLVYIAFMLGMYTNGIARWGFDGLLQDNAVVQGDATGGTARPSFNTTPQDWARSEGVVRWNAFEDGGWDGYQLLVDDVLRYEGWRLCFDGLFDFDPAALSGEDDLLADGGARPFAVGFFGHGASCGRARCGAREDGGGRERDGEEGGGEGGDEERRGGESACAHRRIRKAAPHCVPTLGVLGCLRVVEVRRCWWLGVEKKNFCATLSDCRPRKPSDARPICQTLARERGHSTSVGHAEEQASDSAKRRAQCTTCAPLRGRTSSSDPVVGATAQGGENS